MPEAAVHVASGKVRELYALDDERLLLVASDRISTFDVVLPTEIPDKGRVLTGLSGFWFARTREIVPNHLLALRAGRPLDRVPAARDAADRVRRARLPRRLGLEGLPRDRARSAATRCRPGLRESEQLPEPIFTPATKAHDRPRREHRPRAQAAELVGERALRRGRAHRRSTLYRFAAEHAAERGIIIADTKFELGLDDDGNGSCSADEAFTPDSSRFWPADEYAAGRHAAVVRQAVRARLLRVARLGQDRTRARSSRTTSSPGTRARYVEAFERLTGICVRRLPRRPGGRAAMRRPCSSARSRGSSTRRARRSSSSLRQLGFAVERRARRPRGRPRGRRRRHRPDARASVERMCEQLLANPLIESYEIERRRGMSEARARDRGRRLPGLERRPRRRAARSRQLGADASPRLACGRAELPRGTAPSSSRRLLVRRLPSLRRDRALRAGDATRSRRSPARAASCSESATASRSSARPACSPACCARTRRSSFVCRDVRAPRRARATRRSPPACEPGQRLVDPGQARRGLLLRATSSCSPSSSRAGRSCSRYEDNPNGSIADVAGVVNADGNVFGLMPHRNTPSIRCLAPATAPSCSRFAGRRRARAATHHRLAPAPRRAAGRSARPARSRSKNRAAAASPARAAPFRPSRTPKADEPLAARRLQQLHDRREPLLAGTLGQRQLLDELRRAPRVSPSSPRHVPPSRPIRTRMMSICAEIVTRNHQSEGRAAPRLRRSSGQCLRPVSHRRALLLTASAVVFIH